MQVNPFKDRIVDVFSSSGDGDMTFEDFLDMLSVFSDSAPKNVKVEYAFRIYGRYQICIQEMRYQDTKLFLFKARDIDGILLACPKMCI